MNRWLSLGVLSATLGLAAPCQATDIYYFVDGNGVTHFTDNCTSSRCKLFLRAKVRNLTIVPSAPISKAKMRAIVPGTNYTAYTTPGYSKPRRINEANRQRYAPQIALVANKYGLDPRLIHAVISAESAYNPGAVSPKGAMGLMQLMPGTADRFGVGDPFDPLANLHGGARYLRWLMDKFNNLQLALAAYNAGEGAVIRYGNTIPPYEETRTYVARVLNFYGSSQGGLN